MKVRDMEIRFKKDIEELKREIVLKSVDLDENKELKVNIEDYHNIDKYIKMGGKDLGYVFVSGINDIYNYKEKIKNLSNGNKICVTSFYKQIKNICGKSKIEKNNKISPHTLRHFFGTSIYENTNDLVLTQEAMRHSDLSTTRRYVHINQKKIQEALSNFNI